MEDSGTTSKDGLHTPTGTVYTERTITADNTAVLCHEDIARGTSLAIGSLCTETHSKKHLVIYI
jgi:hypothetical protein